MLAWYLPRGFFRAIGFPGCLLSGIARIIENNWFLRMSINTKHLIPFVRLSIIRTYITRRSYQTPDGVQNTLARHFLSKTASSRTDCGRLNPTNRQPPKCSVQTTAETLRNPMSGYGNSYWLNVPEIYTRAIPINRLQSEINFPKTKHIICSVGKSFVRTRAIRKRVSEKSRSSNCLL